MMRLFRPDQITHGPAVGSRLGHYDVTTLISEGCMARCIARDTKLDRVPVP
jgi:hypothetical protein